MARRKPTRLEFPLRRAHVAIDAIRDLVEELRDAEKASDQGAGDLQHRAFQGEFSDWFTAANDDVTGQIGARITHLEGEADDLTAHIVSAREAVHARDVSRQHWNQAYARWDNWTPPARSTRAIPR